MKIYKIIFDNSKIYFGYFTIKLNENIIELARCYMNVIIRGGICNFSNNKDVFVTMQNLKRNGCNLPLNKKNPNLSNKPHDSLNFGLLNYKNSNILVITW